MSIQVQLLIFTLIIQTRIACLYVAIRGLIYRIFYSKLSRAPYPEDENISSDWLTSVLRKKGCITENDSIASLEVENLQASSGRVGRLRKIKITYKNEQSVPEKAPKSLVVKSLRPNYSSRLLTNTCSAWREAKFYGSSFSRQVPADLKPEVYYTYYSEFLAEYLIILEDLSHGTPMNFLFGNQCWGVPPAFKEKVEARSQIEDCENMFRAIAKLHAKFWRDKRLIQSPEYSWLKAAKWYQGKDRVTWELAMHTAKKAWAKGKKISPDLYSKKLISIIDESLARSSWETFQAHLKKNKPWTLIHGDFYPGNLIAVTKDDDNIYSREEKIVAVDWPEVGPWEPTVDLGQALVSDVPSALFIEHGKRLVQRYWEELISSGVDAQDYSFEECWQDYCRTTVEKWIFLVAVLFGFQDLSQGSTKWLKYLHDQVLAFIEAHGDKPYYELKPAFALII